MKFGKEYEITASDDGEVQVRDVAMCPHSYDGCLHSQTVEPDHVFDYCCTGGEGCEAYTKQFLRNGIPGLSRGQGHQESILIGFDEATGSAVRRGASLVLKVSPEIASLLVFDEDTHVPMERPPLSTDTSPEL